MDPQLAAQVQRVLTTGQGAESLFDAPDDDTAIILDPGALRAMPDQSATEILVTFTLRATDRRELARVLKPGGSVKRTPRRARRTR